MSDVADAELDPIARRASELQELVIDEPGAEVYGVVNGSSRYEAVPEDSDQENLNPFADDIAAIVQDLRRSMPGDTIRVGVIMKRILGDRILSKVERSVFFDALNTSPGIFYKGEAIYEIGPPLDPTDETDFAALISASRDNPTPPALGTETVVIRDTLDEMLAVKGVLSWQRRKKPSSRKRVHHKRTADLDQYVPDSEA